MAKKKNPITDEFLQGRAQSIFRTSANFRDQKIAPRWMASNDLYDSMFSKTSSDYGGPEREKSDVLTGQGRLFIPKTYSHLQRMLVDVLDTIFFDAEELVNVVSWKNIPSETRDIVKTLLNYRLNGHPINFYEEAYEACIDAMKNKVGIIQVYPELKSEKDADGNEKITSFHPMMECLPYEDVFFDPKATWKDYYRFPIVTRMIRSKDYLKRRGYINLDMITSSDTFQGSDQIKQQRSLDQGSPFTADAVLQAENSESIMVYIVWDFLDIDGTGQLSSCSYTLAGDGAQPKILIKKAEKNDLPYEVPGWDYNRPPIFVGSAFPEPHKMYGKDLPQIVEGLQRETNSQRNQRREAVALALRKPILANRSAGLDLMQLVNRKIGSVVLGDDISPSSVRELDISDPTASTIQEQQTTSNDFYETTSIPPNLMGMPTSQDETATAVTSHVANANKKIAQLIRNLVVTLFLPSFKALLRLEQTYETDEFIEMVTARKLGWKLANDAMPPTVYIQGDFDLVCNMGINKQLQLNKWLMIMDRGNQYNATVATMVQNRVVDPGNIKFFNPSKAWVKVLSLLGEKAYEEFEIQATPPPPEPSPGGAKGVASITGLSGSIPAEVSNMNPEGIGVNGI
jgi:hypothetical protein